MDLLLLLPDRQAVHEDKDIFKFGKRSSMRTKHRNDEQDVDSIPLDDATRLSALRVHAKLVVKALDKHVHKALLSISSQPQASYHLAETALIQTMTSTTELGASEPTSTGNHFPS